MQCTRLLEHSNALEDQCVARVKPLLYITHVVSNNPQSPAWIIYM